MKALYRLQQKRKKEMAIIMASKKWFVTVKDSGTGIDPEIMPRLFTRFTTKSFQRTGLGLCICKNIIETHGGKIWANNNNDGKGAAFSFSLPLCN